MMPQRPTTDIVLSQESEIDQILNQIEKQNFSSNTKIERQGTLVDGMTFENPILPKADGLIEEESLEQTVEMI